MTAPETINYRRAIEYLQSVSAEYSERKFGRIRIMTNNGTIDYWPNRGTARVRGSFEVKHIKELKSIINAQ